ncbi:MAG TPA: mechanosensitive ion channel family protein, partial [Chloroflexaceae bacterium]|nr:mechanosensitive ion channel family protein [Chloroflexaceae bacterium]
MDLTPMREQLQGMLDYTLILLPNLVVGLLVFVLFVLASRGLRGLARRFSEERRRHRNLGLVLGRLAYGAGIFLGALVALTIIFPSLSPADMLGALGIGGIVVGFAFRDIAQNFLAGILILLTEPFRINDQIVYKEFEGTVEDIQVRATTIRTYDGRRVVIPNAELFTNAVTVNTAFDKRRLQFDVGIGYGDDIGRARELVLDAIRGVDGVLQDPPPDALVVGLSDSAVSVRARWWIQPPRRADALDMQDRVLQAIKERLLANGIDLPYPTQQILFHDQTEETDGARRRQREGWPAGLTEQIREAVRR